MTTSKRPIIYMVTNLWPLPEKVEEVKKILVEIVPEAKKERACLKYELCVNVNEKAQFTCLHAWSTEDALNEHLNSELITKATGELQNLLSKPTEYRRYQNIG